MNGPHGFVCVHDIITNSVGCRVNFFFISSNAILCWGDRRGLGTHTKGPGMPSLQ